METKGDHKVGFLQKAETQGNGAPAAGLAVFASDSALRNALKRLCRSQGLGFHGFKSPAKLLKQAPEMGLFAVVWDARTGEPDWEGLRAMNGRTTVIVLGDCAQEPPGDCHLPVLRIPPDAGDDQVTRTVNMVAQHFLTVGRLEESRERLEATERRLAELAQHTKALENHVEFYELQRNQLSEVVRRTAYLGQLSKEINCLDIDKIVDICVTKVPKIVDAKLASVYLYDTDACELVLKQSNHSYRITDRVVPGSTPQTLMSLAVDRKATLLIRDLDTFSLGIKKPLERTYARKYSSKSCIIVPLMNDNQVLAVLNLADKTNGVPFDEVRDLPLVDHISQFIGIALRNCQLYDEVWLLAKTDALTGFMNHNAFFDELSREIGRVKRTGMNLSLILLDVDNFKLFNDVHGHQLGDMVLTQAAEIIRASIRNIDIPARYGGDEFAIILGDTNGKRAQLVAERIRRAVAANQLRLDGQNFFVTVSAGVTQYKNDQSLSDLVNEADAALYRAKSLGRNTVSCVPA